MCHLPTCYELTKLVARYGAITKLELSVVQVPFEVIAEGKNMCHLWVKAKSNSWSHQRRKRREMQRLLMAQQQLQLNDESKAEDSEDAEEAASAKGDPVEKLDFQVVAVYTKPQLEFSS